MKKIVLSSLIVLAISTSVHAASPTTRPSEPSPTFPASQWDPGLDQRKGPPGGDA